MKLVKNIAKHPARIAVLFFVLFASYWCGITMFTHSHVVNGVAIVHSHPFQSEHTHTAEQIQTIFYFSHFITSGKNLFSTALSVWLIALMTIIAKPVSQNLPQTTLRHISPRGPPQPYTSI